MRIKDKVAIVTGAGGGIGGAISRALAAEGASVVVADLNEQAARETCKSLAAFNGRFLSMKVDVRSEDDVKRLVDETVKQFGHLDILCANAGVSTIKLTVDATEEEWNFNMDVNAKGIFFCDKHAARQMIKQGKGGKIINTSSQLGKHGAPYFAHYTASKHAVIGLTVTLAQELGPYKINVNAICPGDIETPLLLREIPEIAKLRGTENSTIREELLKATPLGRLGKPEDVARVVVFLASEESDYVTGQAINIGTIS
ncbi:MAG: SDR family NAD(P)-dependent oxidoreductase [Candidatus Bathyarchaeia archaeon]